MSELAVERRGKGALDRLARVLSEVLAPVILAYAVSLAVAIGTTPPLWRGTVVGLLVATLTAGLPFAAVVVGSRRGRLSGRHVPERQQRPLVLALAAMSSALALVAARWLKSDPAVIAMVLAVLFGLLVAGAISLVWKLSIHTAGATGAACVLAIVFGPTMLLVTPAVVALAWSRVRLGEHGVLEVIGGAAIGALVTTGVMVLVQ